ncbi:hypothetical protein [Mycobacterium leprae]|nr:hypothetical protein [Mycobacterium leprae]
MLHSVRMTLFWVRTLVIAAMNTVNSLAVQGRVGDLRVAIAMQPD